MMNLLYSAVLIPLAKINPGVKPNSNAPFIKTLQDIAGSIAMASAIIAVIALIVGAVLFVFGKIGGNGRAQDVGFMVVVWVLVGAAIIGSASGLVSWGSSLTLAT